jgi:hypothetical protein
MNTIALRLQPGETPAYSVAQILVDGHDLIGLVRVVELPQATEQGQPDLAGSYHYLEPFEWADLPERGEDGRAAVLRCTSGEVGCWPLRVRITRHGGVVTWSDFQQPFRNWSYDGFGPFHFREDEYDAAVAGIAASRDQGTERIAWKDGN